MSVFMRGSWRLGLSGLQGAILATLARLPKAMAIAIWLSGTDGGGRYRVQKVRERLANRFGASAGDHDIHSSVHGSRHLSPPQVQVVSQPQQGDQHQGAA